MNKELFASMRAQMVPSGEAQAALRSKLASAKKKTVPVGRYVAIAACAAVIVAAVPVYRAVRNRYEWCLLLNSFEKGGVVEPFKPHSYVLASDPACWPEDNAVTENATAGVAGDQDQDMTPGELTDNMLEAGFTLEDADAFLASGWRMTWAKWWKFYHQSEETGDRTLEALLDFAQAEGLAVNPGEEPVEIPGGAYVSDEPDQSEAIMAYQNLMDRFKADYGPDAYPEWYGGAYIDGHGGLIVNIVADYESEDKALYHQIQDWAGSNRVGFSSCSFSLGYLRRLQNAAFDAMYELGLAVGCGVNEETGQVELTISAATGEALLRLAELDPTDTAILVIVGQAANLTVSPAPSVTHNVQPGGGMGEDAVAVEPRGQ